MSADDFSRSKTAAPASTLRQRADVNATVGADEDATEHAWERVLWKEQPFADNYIPPHSFLSALRRNPNFRPYTYWHVVSLSCNVTQHLATIFVFALVFADLKEGRLEPQLLIWFSILAFCIGLGLVELLNLWSERPKSHGREKTIVKSSILTFLALLSVSPVLKTLTAATSSDSIWALSASLFVLNALLADYSDGNPQGRLTSALSMNAAISASVVLASRLSTDLAAFALVLLAVQAFALFPILRHRLHQDTSAWVRSSLTLVLSSLAVWLPWKLSAGLAALFATVLSSVTFVIPAVLVWAQKYKNEIRGPWDVAVPQVKSRDA